VESSLQFPHGARLDFAIGHHQTRERDPPAIGKIEILVAPAKALHEGQRNAVLLTMEDVICFRDVTSDAVRMQVSFLRGNRRPQKNKAGK